MIDNWIRLTVCEADGRLLSGVTDFLRWGLDTATSDLASNRSPSMTESRRALALDTLGGDIALDGDTPRVGSVT